MNTNKLLCILPFFLCFLTLQANEIVHIPDLIFKNTLLNRRSINTNGDGEIQISEAQAFTGGINCRDKNIHSLTGIEAFVNITSLDCSKNSIELLDLSKNTKLTYLNCGNNLLTSLNILECKSLKELKCDFNNHLETFDTSNFGSLETINFSYCKLSVIDLSAATNLISIEGIHNELQHIELPENSKLEIIKLRNNALVTIDFKTSPFLHSISLTNNKINSINIEGCPSLKIIILRENKLETLNTSKNPKLEIVLGTLNKLKHVDFSENNALRSLSLGYNELESIDVSKNINLVLLSLTRNQIEMVDFSKNTGLETLRIPQNRLKTLDLSLNTALKTVTCNENELTILNLKNGNNTLVNTFDATNNANLNCIQVDNPNDVLNNPVWKKDDFAIFSTSCQTASLNDVTFEKTVLVSPNPVIDLLTISLKNQSSFLRVSIVSSIGQQVLSSRVNKIDLSHLTKGVYFLKIEDNHGKTAIKKIIKS